MLGARRVRVVRPPTGTPARADPGSETCGERILPTATETGVAVGAALRRRGCRLPAGVVVMLCSLQAIHILAFHPSSDRIQQPAGSADKALDPGIRATLQAYQDALESLDADAVKKVQPSIDVEGLKRAFREMRSLDVDIDNIRLLSADQAAARVSCRVAQTLTPRAGSRQTTTVTRVLRLKRDGSGWVIDAFER